jgi:hypothetical protein
MGEFRPDVRRGLLALLAHHYRWQVAVPFLICVLLFAVAAWQGRSAERLLREGVTAMAEVLALEVEVPEASGARPRHFVTLRFTAASGEVIEQRRQVSEGFHAGLAAGQQVPVTYAASKPESFEVEPGSIGKASGGARMAAWLAGLIGLGVLVWAGMRLRGAMAARAVGREVRALVRRHKRHAGETVTHVHLLWETEDGRRGQTRLMSVPQAQRYPKGSAIVMREEPGGTRLWWEGDL